MRKDKPDKMMDDPYRTVNDPAEFEAKQRELVMAAEMKDRDHVNVIAILHYVWGGLIGLGALFIVLYMLMLKTLFEPIMSEAASSHTAFSGGVGGSSGGSVAPVTATYAFDNMLYMMYIIYGSLAVLCLIACICNVISGRCMHKRKGRVFSLVVGAFNCLMIPLGTVLGIFTFIVLCRNSVAQLYNREVPR